METFWILLFNGFLAIGLFIVFSGLILFALDISFYVSTKTHNAILSTFKSNEPKIEGYSFLTTFIKDIRSNKLIFTPIIGIVIFYILKLIFADLLKFKSAILASNRTLLFYKSVIEFDDWNLVMILFFTIPILFGVLIISASFFKLMLKKKPKH
jgi:hypothetical protein